MPNSKEENKPGGWGRCPRWPDKSSIGGQIYDFGALWRRLQRGFGGYVDTLVFKNFQEDRVVCKRVKPIIKQYTSFNPCSTMPLRVSYEEKLSTLWQPFSTSQPSIPSEPSSYTWSVHSFQRRDWCGIPIDGRKEPWVWWCIGASCVRHGSPLRLSACICSARTECERLYQRKNLD